MLCAVADVESEVHRKLGELFYAELSLRKQLTVKMDYTEESLHGVSQNLSIGNADAACLDPVLASSQQASEKSSTVLCASDVENASMKAVSCADVDVQMEINAETHACQDPCESMSTLVENASSSNAACKSAIGVESSEDSASSGIVSDLKVHVSSSQSIAITQQMPTDDMEFDSQPLAMSTAAAAEVDELKLSRNDKSEKASPLDSDGEKTSADTGVTSAGMVEAQLSSSMTDDIPPSAYGADIEDLLMMRSDVEVSSLTESDNVIVLYDVEDQKNSPYEIPGPFPNILKDNSRHMWDRDYVRMPYAADSAENWQQIATVLKELTNPIDSLKAVEDAIKQYHDYPESIDFRGLEGYFCEKDADVGLLSRTCLLELIPKMAKLAVDLPDVCTRPIRLLRRQKDSMIAMSQYQASCLLANAFFCTYPLTASHELRDMSFVGLFRQPPADRRGAQYAKLDCMFNYFRRVISNKPTGIITFKRQVS